MKKETDLFFEHILRADRPILDFLDAPYTFLNQRLAEFYRVPGVKGHAFRKVDLTSTPRGGVLGQASILAVSSYANRTSPVLRGKWILENLLGAPPPPPPPDVPALEEHPLGKAVSLRARLEQHRANPTCAACHGAMDPLGLALENFSAVGQYRANDPDTLTPIDAKGQLPDGTTIDGPEDLRKQLAARPDHQFVQALTENL